MIDCFVRFEVDDNDRLERLRAAFEAIKHDKETGTFREVEEWLAYFADQELARFWWPSDEELDAYMMRWHAVTFGERAGDPELSAPGWLFESFIGALDDGDYTLLSCELIENGQGKLRFVPHGYPYGGTDALYMLIRAFGFSVTGVDDGTGYKDVPS